MKKKEKKPWYFAKHERSDKGQFNDIQKRFDDLILVIPKAVEEAVDKKINGKLIAIKNQLEEQNKAIQPVIKVFEDNKIYKMKLKEEGGTIYFYGRVVLTVAGVGALAWAIIKTIRI